MNQILRRNNPLGSCWIIGRSNEKPINICKLADFFHRSTFRSGWIYDRTRFQTAGQTAIGNSLYGYDNPAVLAYLRSFELSWCQGSDAVTDKHPWSLAAAIPQMGFNFFHDLRDNYSVNDYHLSFARRLTGAGIGLGYEWHTGAKEIFNRHPLLKFGLVLRPAPMVSVSSCLIFATTNVDREFVMEIAVRPWRTDRLTIFADMVRNNFASSAAPQWSAGFYLEPLTGVRLNGRYFENKSYAAGVYFSLGRLGAHTQFHFNEQADRTFSSLGIRLGGYDRTFLRTLTGRRSRYLGLDLKGEVKYRPSAFFDKSRTFFDLLTLINHARVDPVIAGLTLNLSGMVIDAEKAWELRTALQLFKKSGKQVVIYLDEAGMTEYHLASVADRIVMDPCGTIMLPGVMRGRYYVRRTLDKLGIGVEEWRFFKYKSAAETVARDKMSDANREQWQALVDDHYELIKNDVCQSRGFSAAHFDSLVNHWSIFSPEDARRAGLVDTIGRADAVDKVIAALEGKKKTIVSPSILVDKSAPWDYQWGELPVIAVVYALGECAMDQGIKARSLSKDLEKVTKDRRVKAVVFRVDSPGGDVLASDIVAEALKKCSAQKPVIVTQGLVAGSGGYWISMYGDTILAAPNTITGSIGVIGFWLYNQNFNEKTGITTDRVLRGEHADLGFGFSYPLLGTLPDRNLSEEEYQKMEMMIRDYYRQFVARVAQGRNLSPDSIDAVGQGRVWSGIDGRDCGLVDEIGGLLEAIAIARIRAGIPPDALIKIIELPQPPFLPENLFQPKLIGIDDKTSQFLKRLELLCRFNGRALAVMPLEYLIE